MALGSILYGLVLPIIMLSTSRIFVKRKNDTIFFQYFSQLVTQLSEGTVTESSYGRKWTPVEYFQQVGDVQTFVGGRHCSRVR